MIINKTQKMILCALFTALIAIFSQVAIPIGPIPINLAVLAVFLAGALLGAKLATLSMIIWVGMGSVSVPVFSMFRSGLGTLAGPTGGYIIGYIPAAYVVGLITEKTNKDGKLHLYITGMIIGMVTYFSFGAGWFMFSTNTGFWEGLMTCVIPFLPGDLIKVAVSAVIAKRLHRISLIKV